MQTLRMRFDGRELSDGEYMGAADWSITKRRKREDGSIATDVAGTFTFTGAAFDEIKRRLIDNPAGANERIYCEIYDTCCGGNILFTGYIAYDSIDWCFGTCSVSCDLRESGQDAEQLQCFQTTYVFDNSQGFQNLQHPFVRYCGEMRPTWLMDMFVVFGIIVDVFLIALLPMLLIVAIIIAAYNIVANILGLDEIGDSIDGGVFDWWGNIWTQWNNYISGCFRGHPAPFLRDYIINVCKICGLTFNSTILNQPKIQGNESWNTVGLQIGDDNPYFNGMWLYAPVIHGAEQYTKWLDENKPIYTGEKFLNLIREIFNADYRIIAGVLTLERKDYFLQTTPWLDLSNPSAPDSIVLLNGLCMSHNSDKQPAWGDFQLQQDGVDWVGNEAKKRINEIVNWDVPAGAYPNLVGDKQFLLPIGMFRFRDDSIDTDAVTRWDDFFDAIGLRDFMFKAEYDNALLLPMDLCFLPKLMIWDGVSPLTNAKVARFIPPFTPDLHYNVRVTFSYTGNVGASDVPPKPYIPGNLYDGFWSIEDPRLPRQLLKNWTAKLARNCDAIRNLSFDKYVKLPQVFDQDQFGTIEEVEISDTEIIAKGRM